MRHYGIGQWTDFVRGVAGTDEGEMREHLDTGCESCQRVERSLRRVSLVGDGEPERLSAEEVLGPIRGLFGFESRVLELVWDSARAPSFARGDLRETRRELHFADREYKLEMLVERPPGGGARLLGRLVPRTAADVDALRVRLLSESSVIDLGSTDSGGGFVFWVQAAATVEVQVALSEERELVARFAVD